MTILDAKTATDRFLVQNGEQQNQGLAYLTNAPLYMSVSAGQYATVERFALIQRFFGADSRISSASFTAASKN